MNCSLHEVLILLELVLIYLTCFHTNVGVKKENSYLYNFWIFTVIFRGHKQNDRDFMVSEKNPQKTTD